MKSEDLGQFLEGLATSLDGHLKKAVVDDLNRLGGFLRSKGKTSVKKLLEGLHGSDDRTARSSSARSTTEVSDEAEAVIRAYRDLERRASGLSSAEIRREMAPIGRHKRAAIDAILKELGYPRAKTKKESLQTLVERLERGRLSDHQVGLISQ